MCINQYIISNYIRCTTLLNHQVENSSSFIHFVLQAMAVD
ncbi:hypothetical protein F383_21514 [Gossypium arboreum]|uniref:Uncharacterized protein n=1 Tax=Gossypium arboreum TaxID=29729 RepID=A0A0B0NZ87_GOSAR|nr:hypothetical protein F383_21514 [Gossypium arboreum]